MRMPDGYDTRVGERGLVAEILEHPAALCHRDFHANNLLPAGDSIGVIDFQDLRRGPDSYDIASLLYDAKADLPPDVTALIRQSRIDRMVPVVARHPPVEGERLRHSA